MVDLPGPSRLGFPQLSTGVVLGITCAIAGNVLISLALNLQKLAHKRLDALRRNTPVVAPPSNDQHIQRSIETAKALPFIVDQHSESERFPATETQPLLPSSLPPSTHYGSTEQPKQQFFLSRLLPERWRSTPQPKDAKTLAIPVEVAEVIPESTGVKPLNYEEENNETEYLKSKLWWLGFCLMNVGELGNFISYAWAPASVVAPLGTFALIANCVFSPLILKERFRKRDLLGIALAVVGAVTVVVASNASDTRLNPDALVKAIKQIPFIIYSCIYVAGAVVLAVLSEGRIGRQWVFVDVGLCALFGGFTVLSTKAVSTLLTMEWISMFKQIITYPVLLVLISTGVGQIRYLNRALMRFDSKIVIPAQFVLFNLSAIVGSAILYGDFKRASFHQVVTFLYGCGATFTGVFIIAWAPSSMHEEDDALEDELDQAPELSGRPLSPVREGQETLGRRRRAVLVLQPGGGDVPTLRHRQSAMSLIGLSPAQHLLLVHTPPRDYTLRDLEQFDPQTPESSRRRRIPHWFGDEYDSTDAPARRDSSVGRRRVISSASATETRFRRPTISPR